MKLSISGGKYRRTQINIPDNLSDFRPTKSILREALCSIIQLKIPEAEVLELCSGTCIFSMEMISRGAKTALSVEKNGELCKYVENQIKRFSWSEQIKIKNADVLEFAQKNIQKFDIIYFDPPYNIEELNAVAKILPNFLKEGGVFIFEFATGDTFATKIAQSLGAKLRKYGKSSVAVVEK